MVLQAVLMKKELLDTKEVDKLARSSVPK